MHEGGRTRGSAEVYSLDTQRVSVQEHNDEALLVHAAFVEGNAGYLHLQNIHVRTRETSTLERSNPPQNQI